MKRILCVFVCILLLSGCERINTKENEIPDFMGFRTDVKITFNNVEISAYTEYDEVQGLSIVLKKPESVKDMRIVCKDGKCKIDYQELSFSFSHKKLPYSSFFVALESCAENIKTSIYENGYYSYVVNGNICHLYVDEKTKNFVKLSVNETDMLFFENFEYVMGQTQ